MHLSKKVFVLLFPSLMLAGMFSAVMPQENTPELYINEFLASNASVLYDSDYQAYSDWIEIYNAEDTVVQLGGFYLTDDLDDPLKWQIPENTPIRPGWHLVFWADDNNAGRHTNFKLSADGEQIGLFSPSGAAIDTLTYPPQTEDISFGRYPDGSSDWYLFSNPTPAATNSGGGFKGIAADPVFAIPGGFYTGTQQLALSSATHSTVIRYTTDGSIPTEVSSTYSGPVSLDSTCVIRARVFGTEYIPSHVITQTYFIDEDITLPVISLATDPANLWDDEIGIYVEGTNGIVGYCSDTPKNWNQDWERPVSIELFEKGGPPGFRMDAGVKIGGGCTRKYPQKSLAIYARSEYGESKINYKLFDDKPFDTYNNLVLRNHGQDYYRALIRDGLMHTIVKGRMDIEWQAYRPVILFLNGAYWGIHGLREKHNEHYLATNYGLDPDEIDILTNNATIFQGSAEYYTNLIDFIAANDMSDDENYRYVKTQMEINAYLDYVIAEIYFANVDWPGGNIKYWRPHGENNRWRWILFDTDLGFGAHSYGQYYTNTLELVTSESQTYYANPTWSTLLLRRLLENNIFRNDFIQRFAGHMNTTLRPDRVLSIIDSLQANIAAEIPRHKARWETSMSFGESWEALVEIMREFARERPSNMISHLNAKFSLNGIARLDISTNIADAGIIRINTVEIPGLEHQGTYFKNVPLYCQVAVNKGYRFAGWEGISTETADSITITLEDDAVLTALFEPDQLVYYEGLCINELMALNSSTITDDYGNYDDWIELYNNGTRDIDIGGLYVTDDLQQPGIWQIPETTPGLTTIKPGEYLLLWADNEPEQGVRHLDFRLSVEGEEIGVSVYTGASFVYIDSIRFGAQSDDVSFGRYPDGTGNFVALHSPTPGYGNIVTSVNETVASVPESVFLLQNYPNPFNSGTVVRYSVVSRHSVTLQPVELSIYNIMGQRITTLVSGHQPAGDYEVRWDASEFPSGIYYCRLTVGNGNTEPGILWVDRGHIIRKMILMK